MHRNRKLAVLVVLILTFCSGGCAALGGAHAPHPGSANKFDSDAYDAVFVAHNIIESTKTQLSKPGGFPPNIAPGVSKALAYLIDAYNISDNLYKDYHAAAIAGQATQAQSTALSNALADMNDKTAALTAAKAGKP